MADVDNDKQNPLSIDDHALETLWAEQPRLFFKYAKKAAAYRLKMDQAKSRLEVTRAEVYRDVRDNPSEFGIEGKATEKAIEAAVIQSVRVVGAEKELNEARHDNAIASGMVTALEHRKSALENRVKLMLANYYAEPRAPKEGKEEMEEMVKDQVRRRGRRTGDD